jgi:hypothetical protein
MALTPRPTLDLAPSPLDGLEPAKSRADPLPGVENDLALR